MFRTAQSPPSDATLGDFLRWAVTTYADNSALVYRPQGEVETWSYARLQCDADRVSGWLQRQGVRKGDRVLIWAPNSPWWVVAFFGIQRIGGVVVPLDVQSAPDFARRVVEQTEPTLALLSQATVEQWNEPTPHFLIDQLPSLLAADGATDLPKVAPNDLAEIVFTSGPTGAPRGVMLTHRNLLTNVEACNQVLPAGREIRPLSILPLSHLFEQTVGLLLQLRGGTRIAYATSHHPAAILGDMGEYRVTTMLVVPLLLTLFMDGIEQEVTEQGRERTWSRLLRIAQYLPRRVRRILFREVLQRLGGELDFFVVGGAALDPEIERKWELLGVAILRGYGSTETAPVIAATPWHGRKSGSVGKPISGVQVRLTPDGEILAKGPNVTPGYWRNPEATASAFADGWYRTGDLGEMDAEGRLYLRGRKKDMIVLANGMNVYPRDIEQVVRAVPGVRDVVVTEVPSPRGPQIHAVLLCGDGAPDLEAVVRQANAQLAHHQHIRSWSPWGETDLRRPTIGKVIVQESESTLGPDSSRQRRPA